MPTTLARAIHAGAPDGELRLSPTQQAAFDTLAVLAQRLPVTLLSGGPGSGKTTILRELQRRIGGRLITLRDMLEAVAAQQDGTIEEAARGLVEQAFLHDDLVLIDNLSSIEAVTRMTGAYARPFLFDAVEATLFDTARALGKRIVAGFSADIGHQSYASLQNQGVRVQIAPYTALDYAIILGHVLGAGNIGHLDFEEIYSHARQLTAYQLQAAALILVQQGVAQPTTDQILACMNQHLLTSNLVVGEVEKIEFSTLKGTEQLVAQLETMILLPMQHPELARRLGLKPKRGVLLHGLPGTGKTSIGRALAHRMKGRFFMIDGTFITEPPSAFFNRVKAVFNAAQANSPSVIFIDDADVLFKTDHVYGLNRYLLTKLDGLESESVGAVCVMMTAMDINDIPPAILRSGRVEVWLETKLPDLETRRDILTQYAQALADEFDGFDPDRLARATEGFTPADLRRIVGDAKAFLAYDMHREKPLKSFGAYIAMAALAVRELKNNIARATGQTLACTSDDLDLVSACGC